MPKGEPTRVVRLPVWLLDLLERQARHTGATVPELIVRRLAPRDTPAGPVVADGQGGSLLVRRCSCAKPVLSKVATNVCTNCGQLR